MNHGNLRVSPQWFSSPKKLGDYIRDNDGQPVNQALFPGRGGGIGGYPWVLS